MLFGKQELRYPVWSSTAYGSPALKVYGQLVACVPTNKSAEPGSLMVRIDRKDRPSLLAEAPDLYYVTDHYLDYDAVLVRLERLSPELLQDLLAMAHRFITKKDAKPTGRSSVVGGKRPRAAI